LLKHRSAESTDARGFIVDSAAFITGTHAGINPRRDKNIRAGLRLFRERAHDNATCAGGTNGRERKPL
jgi:hypothetical protein